jgi:glycosyltransferase involved in cell wall biosynthesis
MVQNHLQFWPKDRLETHLVPNYPPKSPEPFGESTYHDLTNYSAKSWSGLSQYVHCLSQCPLTRPWVYRQFLSYNRALSHIIKETGINILYAHQVWPAGASAVLQSRIHGIPSVVVAYGETWHTTPQHQRQQRVEPYVLNGASWVISTSEHCLTGALNRGASQERASVIYAGIDLDRFHPRVDGSPFREKYGIPPGSVVISALGIALRRKLDTLLDALEGQDLGSDIHCLIGGVGDDSAYVAARAEAIRGVKVHLLGFVPEAELPAFYAATDILVVSPRTLLECMGQSMKEAMCCGRAVVGARIGGVPEAINDGYNGLLFEPDDPVDLARALNRLAKVAPLRNELGQNGRRLAEQKFSAEVAAQQTLEVFEMLLAKPAVK